MACWQLRRPRTLTPLTPLAPLPLCAWAAAPQYDLAIHSMGGDVAWHTAGNSARVARVWTSHAAPMPGGA